MVKRILIYSESGTLATVEKDSHGPPEGLTNFRLLAGRVQNGVKVSSMCCTWNCMHLWVPPCAHGVHMEAPATVPCVMACCLQARLGRWRGPIESSEGTELTRDGNSGAETSSPGALAPGPHREDLQWMRSGLRQGAATGAPTVVGASDRACARICSGSPCPLHGAVGCLTGDSGRPCAGAGAAHSPWPGADSGEEGAAQVPSGVGWDQAPTGEASGVAGHGSGGPGCAPVQQVLGCLVPQFLHCPAGGSAIWQGLSLAHTARRAGLKGKE